MEKLSIGQAVPEFVLPDLDGKMVRLGDSRGRVVLVNFWSAECPWSERTDGVLVPWMQQHPEVVVLCVAANGNEPPDMLRSVAAERGLPTVLVDAGHGVADLYGAETTPHCFVVDGEGVLRYQGAFDDVTFRQRTPTRRYAIEAIAALRSGAAVEVPETQAYGCTIVRFAE